MPVHGLFLQYTVPVIPSIYCCRPQQKAALEEEKNEAKKITPYE